MGIFDLFRPYIRRMKENKDVHGLINALKYKDRDVQRRSAEALGLIGDKRAVEQLINTLKDKDLEVRSIVALSL